MKILTVRKMITAVAAVAAASMALAGCSNPTAGGGAGAGADPSSADYWPSATAKLDGVELKMWAAQTSNKIPAKVIEGFEKATGAKVSVETIPDPYEQNVQTKVTTGDVPNLAMWQPTKSMLAGFIAQDKLQKLDKAPWVGNYVEGVADAGGVVDGTRYAAMVSMPSVQGVFYNKDVFKKAGVTDMPKNWNEMVEAARKIKSTGAADSAFFEAGGS